ncbi:MAG: helicase-related protein [Methanomassiliicoccales archaeon]
MFVEHPLIREEAIQDREYQRNLTEAALHHSTLIVLPTGMGKTVIALRVMAEILHREGGKVLFLAPTKPLVEQHAHFLKENLMGKTVTVMTGEVPPGEREVQWIENDVIVSTPQVMANDLRYERISLRDVHLVIFDEAHRGVGSYAYVKVAEEYLPYERRVLGITASPGGSREKIDEVCQNLGIERLEIRSESDPDVAPYVHDINIQWLDVDVPPQMREIADKLRSLFDSYIKEMVGLGLMTKGRPPSKKHLLEVGNSLQARLRAGERRRELYRGLSLQAMAIKVNHALEMVETQGMSALRAYLERLEEESYSEEGTKASKNIAQSEEFKRVKELSKKAKMEHPKLSRVMSIVSNQVMAQPDSRILVFTHFRDTCDLVTSKLEKIPHARVGKLIGQSERYGDQGLKQKDQVALLDRFRRGELNVVVATSVGEEGLDVASTDLVIFYEPVPSEIRTIQRRGRTGRSRAGRVVVLLARGTRDEAYYYSSIKKEKAMRDRLVTMRDRMETGEDPVRAEEAGEEQEDQRTLFDF